MLNPKIVGKGAQSIVLPLKNGVKKDRNKNPNP